jgi:hypothetical protein
MNLKDWQAFLEFPDKHEIRIAQIDWTIARAIGAQTNDVRITPEYARKIHKAHDLKVSEFPALDAALDRGAIYLDGNQHLVIFWQDRHGSGRWYRATLKRCNQHRRLFVCTFHRSNEAQVNSKKSRLKLLRNVK